MPFQVRLNGVWSPNARMRVPGRTTVMKKTLKNTAPSRFRRAILSGVLVILFGGIAAIALWGGYHSRPRAPRAPAQPVPAAIAQPEEVRGPVLAEAPTPPLSPTAIKPRLSPSELPAVPAAAPDPGQDATALRTETKPLDNPTQVKKQPLTAGELSWQPLVKRLEGDGFDAARMETLFASLESPPLRQFMGQKTVELYGRFGKATLNVSDEEKKQFAPPDYTRIAGGMSVAAGRRTIESNLKLFEGLYQQYGVPAPFVVAIMMVETGIGAELGRQSALLSLGSMATTCSLYHVLPVVNGIQNDTDALDGLIKARSDWAYEELKALIQYAEAVNKDATTIPGSVYGAIGICQFMPSNIPRFGASASKARAMPDVFVLSDAACSVARYLSAHGWKKATTPSSQIAVIRSYNHDDVYASTVYGVASALMSPTTHRGAESARKGGNAVTAARESARASIPSGSKKKTKPIENLQRYSDILR